MLALARKIEITAFTHGMAIFSRKWGLLLAALCLIGGCGGGGGGSKPAPDPATLSVSSNAVNVTVTSADSAPTRQVFVSISTTETNSTSFYVSGTYSTLGIDSITSGSFGSSLGLTIQFRSPASLGAGTYTDTIIVNGCRDEACSQQISGSPQTISVTYTVTFPTPQIASLVPDVADASAPGFTLTVSGYQFTAQSVVLWGGSPRPTNYVSSTQLTAQISSADLSLAGSIPVTVQTGTVSSNAATFAISPLSPLLLSRLSPGHVTAGNRAFTLTVSGAGFAGSAKVMWDGGELPTTYVSSTKLRASVPATKVASVGTASIAVSNPVSLGGNSSALQLTIDSPSVDAVSYQMNPAHTGSVSFNSVSLPSSGLWSVDVGGRPSYALIVGGRVFITVQVGAYPTMSSKLLALDATSGAVVWGPINFDGYVNAAYDQGRLFVASSALTNSQLVTALDPTNGNTVWSVTADGGWYPAPPVAADGIVYTLNSGVVRAFDESNGGLLWRGGVYGTYGTVAVTADGVYTSGPCATDDRNPLTGDVVWMVSYGCSGGGGNTPMVTSDGVLYATGTVSTTNMHNADSGVVIGQFSTSAWSTPAANADTSFLMKDSILRAVVRSSNTELWSFTGDGALVTSPIIVNNYVFIGSSNGVLYGLDASTGQQVWMQQLVGAIPETSGGTVQLTSGLAAGDGLLVVPSGTRVNAFLLSSNP